MKNYTYMIIIILLILVIAAFSWVVIRKTSIQYKFIHIPKNAGTALCKAADNHNYKICCTSDAYDWSCKQGAHIDLKDLIKKNKNAIFITTVRDPYDRFISSFSHSKYPNNKYVKDVIKESARVDYTRFSDVNDFIVQIQHKDQNALRAFKDVKFDTQTKYLCVAPDLHKIHDSVKYVLKTEILDKELVRLCKATNICLKLPQDKMDANINTYPKIPLNNNSIRFINNHYSKDFKLLGYSKK